MKLPLQNAGVFRHTGFPQAPSNSWPKWGSLWPHHVEQCPDNFTCCPNRLHCRYCCADSTQHCNGHYCVARTFDAATPLP